MAAKKYLAYDPATGSSKEVAAQQASGGAGDAGKVVALDETGLIDVSMMPVGISADTSAVQASEALAAGDYVNVYNSSGSARARKADASTAGKEATHFTLTAVANGAMATLYPVASKNTQGKVFLATTPGLGTATPPSGSGNIVQQIGFAISATAVIFDPRPPIVLA